MPDSTLSAQRLYQAAAPEQIIFTLHYPPRVGNFRLPYEPPHGRSRGIHRPTCLLYSAYSAPNLSSNPFSSTTGRYTAFAQKNTAIHAAIGHDCKTIASAHNIISTPVIIGFRTYLYGPRTTNRFGGAHGAGVPSPKVKNSPADQVLSPSPAAPTTTPAHNNKSPPPRISAAYRPPAVSHTIPAGTNTTAVPGSIIKVITSLRPISETSGRTFLNITPPSRPKPSQEPPHRRPSHLSPSSISFYAH